MTTKGPSMSRVAFQQQTRRLPIARGFLPVAGLLLLLASLGTAQEAVPLPPPGFGWDEFQEALEQRGLDPGAYRPLVEYSMSLPADGFQIQPSIVRGGSRRGLMYGLLAAAGQLRERKALCSIRATPRFEIRSARLMLTDGILARSPRDWSTLFETLAKARINRLRLEMTALSPSRSAQLGRLAKLAEPYAMDLALGLDEVNAPLLLKTMSQSIALKAARVPPPSAAIAMSALSELGRYVSLDLDAPSITKSLRNAAAELRVPVLGLTRSVSGERPYLWRTSITAPVSLDALAADGATGFEIGPLPEDWQGLARQLSAWSVLAFEEDHVPAVAPELASSLRKAAPKKKTRRQ
jgi:hypothetical protein